jgi:hypothetical protein
LITCVNIFGKLSKKAYWRQNTIVSTIHTFYSCDKFILLEEFEDTKGVIRIRKRTDNTMAKRKKGQKDKHRSTK